MSIFAGTKEIINSSFFGSPPTLKYESVKALNPDFHFSFGSANHRVTSDAFIYAG